MLNFNDIIKESKQMPFRFGQKAKRKTKCSKLKDWEKGRETISWNAVGARKGTSQLQQNGELHTFFANARVKTTWW